MAIFNKQSYGYSATYGTEMHTSLPQFKDGLAHIAAVWCNLMLWTTNRTSALMFSLYTSTTLLKDSDIKKCAAGVQNCGDRSRRTRPKSLAPSSLLLLLWTQTRHWTWPTVPRGNYMHSCPSKLSLTVFLSRRRLLSLMVTPRGSLNDIQYFWAPLSVRWEPATRSTRCTISIT